MDKRGSVIFKNGLTVNLYQEMYDAKKSTGDDHVTLLKELISTYFPKEDDLLISDRMIGLVTVLVAKESIVFINTSDRNSNSGMLFIPHELDDITNEQRSVLQTFLPSIKAIMGGENSLFINGLSIDPTIPYRNYSYDQLCDACESKRL